MSALVTASEPYQEHKFGSFSVDRVLLFKSTLKPSGAVYEKLKEYSELRQHRRIE